MARNDELTHLLALADELANETRKLSGETADGIASLGERARKNRRMILAVSISLVLDMVLTVLLALGFAQLKSNQSDISAITARLDNAQSEQRQKGLCPLYTLFYELTDTPEERKAGKARSANPESYDRSIAIIHEGYRNLKCAEFKGDAPGLPK